jgi:hypothetical protein
MRSYNYGVAETDVLSGIVSAVAAQARAMTPEFDPGGFLEGLSGQLQGLIPHDRLTVLYIDEGGLTVSVFAEHAAGDAPRHDGRYTLSLARASRYRIAEAASSCVFAGQAELVHDAQSDARFMAAPAVPGIPQAGLRTWMALPLMGVEACVTASLTCGAFVLSGCPPPEHSAVSAGSFTAIGADRGTPRVAGRPRTRDTVQEAARPPACSAS